MKIWRRLICGILGAMLAMSLPVFAAEAAPKPVGQFSQWFPNFGVNAEAPEASEAVLAAMGTAIKQSKTVGDETLTLNGALWTGSSVQLSLTAKSPNFPAELDKNSWLYGEECWIKLSEEHWKEYVRNRTEDWCAKEGVDREEVEKRIQNQLDKGQYDTVFGPNFVSREGNTVNFTASMRLDNYLEKPELTLHVENVAIYEKNKGSSVSIEEGKRIGPGPDVPVLKGPFEFTFTLEKVLPPLRYEGAAEMTFGKIPLRVINADVSATGVQVKYAIDVKGPVNLITRDEKPVSGKTNIDMDKDLNMHVEGVWTKDGKYVDCSGSFAIQGVSISADEKDLTGDLSREYPYPMDPASVTAVKISGTRVELGKMNLVTE